MLKLQRNQGFTLMELIVTIAILTVLAGVLVPSVGNYLDKGKKAQAAADMREVANTFNEYKLDTSNWPSNSKNAYTLATNMKTSNFDLINFPCLYKNTYKKPGWDGPYLNKGIMKGKSMTIAQKGTKGQPGTGLCDAWGNAYKVYTYANGYKGTTGGIVLVSMGPNGKIDTSSANIFNAKAANDDVVQLVTYRL